MTEEVLYLNTIIHGKDYESFKEKLKRSILYSKKRVKKAANEIIPIVIEEDILEVTKKELLLNLIMGKIFRELKYQFGESNWYDPEVYSDPESYLDYLIENFQEQEEIKIINNSIAEILMELSDLAIEVNMKLGTTFSIFELIKVVKKEPRLREIIQTTYSELKEFKEIESVIEANFKEALDLIVKHDGSFKELILGGGLNKKQFKQIIAALGPKPNLAGNIIPELPDTNFLMGMRNVQDMYILAETARKVLILSHKNVRLSGYLARKLCLLCIDTLLSDEVEDCGSQHFIKVNLKDEKTFARYTGRWFFYEDDEPLRVLTRKMKKKYLGKTIFVRSPTKCCSKDGRVCHTCYGKLSKINKDLHIGILAALYLSSPLTQNLLSAKHIMESNSPDNLFSEEFLECFDIDKSLIQIKEDLNGYLIIHDIHLEIDDETGKTLTDVIEIRMPQKETKIIELPIELILTNSLLDLMNENRDLEGYYKIRFKDLQEIVPFSIDVQNNEILKSINKIKELLEGKDHLGATNVDQMMEIFVDLLNENNIKIKACHIELIVRELMRSSENLSERPDYSNDYEEDYTILRISDALLKRNSVSVGLSFENLRKQLESPSTFEKDGESLLDIFFLH
jgi:hypothetical protein